jgi:signal transduction histidine kinase
MGMTLNDVLTSSDRLAALNKANLLDTPPEEAFDRITRLASLIIGAPTSLVSLVDKDRQFFKSAVGLDDPLASDRETPLAYSYCQHAVHSGHALIIDDARTHHLVKDSPAILELGAIAYAGIPLIDEDGHALGSFCVTDSKPRVWTEQEIQILHELAALVMTEIRLRSVVLGLREIDRMRAELIAVISHDLRNPLTSILGSTSLLLQRDDRLSADERATFLAIINKQGKRMLQMTEDMMARSKADAEAGHMRREPVDLVQVLRDVVTAFSVSGCPNSFDIDTPEAAVIEGDQGMIEQVLSNLLDNARKYSDEGAQIGARISEQEDGFSVDISDSGLGIAADQLPTVFQPFQQVDDGQDISMGVGLGLHIVRKFVEMHGGSADVSSEEGVGSTFTVRLPRSSPLSIQDVPPGPGQSDRPAHAE